MQHARPPKASVHARYTHNRCGAGQGPGVFPPHLQDAVNGVEGQPRKGGQRVLLVVLVVRHVQVPAVQAAQSSTPGYTTACQLPSCAAAKTKSSVGSGCAAAARPQGAPLGVKGGRKSPQPPMEATADVASTDMTRFKPCWPRPFLPSPPLRGTQAAPSRLPLPIPPHSTPPTHTRTSPTPPFPQHPASQPRTPHACTPGAGPSARATTTHL